MRVYYGSAFHAIMRESRATGALASLSQAPALEEPVQTSSSQGADSNVKQSAKGAMPIEAFRSELLKKIERDQVTIICGETGSGKSTRLPVFIYEQAQAQSKVRRSLAVSLSPGVFAVHLPHFLRLICPPIFLLILLSVLSLPMTLSISPYANLSCFLSVCLQVCLSVCHPYTCTLLTCQSDLISLRLHNRLFHDGATRQQPPKLPVAYCADPAAMMFYLIPSLS